MKTLILSDFENKHDTSFNVEVIKQNKRILKKCVLKKDCYTINDGIYWAMSFGCFIASHYSVEEINEVERLKREEPLRNGDKVIIDNKTFLVKVYDIYSHCAIFEEVL